MRREADNTKLSGRINNKIAAYVLGENCERTRAQNKAIKKADGFLSFIVGGALLIGSVVAFGFWAIAVITIILGVNMLTNTGGSK